MSIKIMLEEWGRMPTRAHDTDAGLDFYAPRDMYINPGGSDSVNTGVHIAIPEGFYGTFAPRSGYLFEDKITTYGVVDAGYTGCVKIILFNTTAQPVFFKKGSKIAQLIITPCLIDDLELVSEFEKTDRGDKGFGSSGA